MMLLKKKQLSSLGIVTVLSLCTTIIPSHADDNKTVAIELAKGKLTLQTPVVWKKAAKKSRILEAELSIPPVEGDTNPGRLTFMAAGGSVKQNIDRWIGQFEQKADDPLIDEMTINGQTVHVIDISGTFKDQRGPFAPATKRKNYRMLGAIIVSKDVGQYFVKMYGPKKTMAENYKGFKEMMESLEIADK